MPRCGSRARVLALANKKRIGALWAPLKGAVMPPSLFAVSRAPDTLPTPMTRAFGVVNSFVERDPTGEIITAVRRFPAREAEFAEFPSWIHTDLVDAYKAKGVPQPYSHQAAAAEAVHGGKNVVIVTPTASGKTLCYNLPVLNAILENTDTRALYLFPTKALAQDQLTELHDLATRVQEGPPGRRNE